jgi:hypothetical protein
MRVVPSIHKISIKEWGETLGLLVFEPRQTASGADAATSTAALADPYRGPRLNLEVTARLPISQSR